MGSLAPNALEYKILTPEGFQDFAGVSFMGDKPVLHMTFDGGIWIKCTEDHNLYNDLHNKKPAGEYEIGDTMWTSDGPVALTSITKEKIQPVFDVVEVGDKHRYYANGILGSNCEFLIFEETLINSIKLMEMKHTEPVAKTGQVRWWKTPKKKHTYIVSMDPSMGTGGDDAALQIFELPGMVQVGEWMHNRTPIPRQVKLLYEVCDYLRECGVSPNDIYYSVENNSLGEATLISINEFGEENIPGVFLSEPKKAGSARTFRRGFNTTNSSKKSACAKLKNLVEADRMTLQSKPLIGQLKTFIASAASYEAKVGERDDLVSAVLLAIRMAMVLQTYNPDIEKDLRDHLQEDIKPMPFIMI